MPKFQLVNWEQTRNAVAAWANEILEIPCYWKGQKVAKPKPPYCTLKLIAGGPGEDQMLNGSWGKIQEDPQNPGVYNKYIKFDFHIIVQFDFTVNPEAVEGEDTPATYIDGLIAGLMVTGNESLNADMQGIARLGEAGLELEDWSSFSTEYDEESGLNIFDVHTFNLQFRVPGLITVPNVPVIKTASFDVKLKRADGTTRTISVTVNT